MLVFFNFCRLLLEALDNGNDLYSKNVFVFIYTNNGKHPIKPMNNKLEN